ncbi:uncharacterized protein FIBRA_02498 [Fibroporia radiculosa]|uniref:GH16 domain-containing protein n=1 Tax=Fibroporia radiculosa TaxID=599839 RepID=J4GMX0_9APHY|nr:uncharacterized protein FIBRA_02498 [Fibroporia radiculosa]CCM00465.1 predicted protein [Fibroporia radiculosa]
MAYRKRDSYSASYSDAYSSVPTTSSPSFAHARSATAGAAQQYDEEAYFTSPFSSTQQLPMATAYSRDRAGSRGGDPSPLSPPRPQFLDGDRHSSSDAETASDSDNSNFGVSTPRANANRVHMRGRSNTNSSQPRAVAASPPGTTRSRNHTRRRSSAANDYSYDYAHAYAAGEEDGPMLNSPPLSSIGHALANPFGSPDETPRNSLYGGPGDRMSSGSEKGFGGRAPPSSYAFQSHTGNPDPLPGGVNKRSSLESIRARGPGGATLAQLPPPPPPSNSGHSMVSISAGPGSYNNYGNNVLMAPAGGNPLSPPGSGTAYPTGQATGGYGLVAETDELGRPYAPFMGGEADRSQTPPSPGHGSLYARSAAGAIASNASAAMSMRAPFLSPASRPTSSLWAPPSYPYAYPPGSGSSTALNSYAGSGLYPSQYPSYADIQAQLRKSKPILPSSRLVTKLTAEEKPWMAKKDGRKRASYWLTLFGMFLGVLGAAAVCYFSWISVNVLSNSELCSVLSEDWSGGLDLNQTWSPDNQLGGFGNGEFQITTTSSTNLYVKNNELYIYPTLTSDTLSGGYPAIFDGGSYTVPDCSTSNKTACSATSSNKTSTVINPVMSSRISTQNSYSIKYGRVEVVAKLPQGDWLWPAIWMLPVNNTYGPWPMSGEIDIMEARGNPPSYPAQGTNFVRSSLNYGVFEVLQTHLFGWWESKVTPYSADFHTYALEWTDSWMRLYVDSRLQAMMNLQITGKGGKSFFDRGAYPTTVQNGSTEAVVTDIWTQMGGGANAPYDQEFYLILDVAAGGTSGWFPDSVGNKPWYDGSPTAMREFALAQETWYATWPSDDTDRAFRVSSVNMWKLC